MKDVMVTFAAIVAALADSTFTVDELEEISETATEAAENAESAYAKVFDLGDRVRVEDLGIQTVVRRNKHTVTVTDGDGGTVKVTPSDILALVEQGDAANFDYFDYFGNHVEEEVAA